MKEDLKKDSVDIDVVIDENYIEPKITIQTKERTGQVENIIYAIASLSRNFNDFRFVATK